MNKILSNSEFAQMIAARFPALDRYDRDIMVFDETGNCAIYAKESKKGYSSVRLGGRYAKTYSQMTAAEKATAIEWVLNLPVEIVTINTSILGLYRTYWVEGAKMKKVESDRGNHWYEKSKAEIVKIEKIY